MLASTLGWPEVALAAIGVVPSTIAAVGVILNRRSLQTPSGTSIGKQVEDARHTGIATHNYVEAVAQKNGVKRARP